MKKLLVCLLSMAFVLAMGGMALAITGPCSNCHTMHNSQDGVVMAKNVGGGTPLATAQAHLTVSTCVGCHMGTWGDGRPVVDGTALTMRAGGTFNTAVATTNRKRHDVIQFPGLGETGAGALTAAPGYTGSDIEVTDLTKFSCAGEFGCHGRHDASLDNDTGINGFHHGTYSGYRFLQLENGTPIPGIGSSTWELGGATAANHNVYSEGTADNTNGISRYCATCHGEFHGTANTKSGTAFIRHPTEVVLPSTWAYNAGATSYDNHPPAFSAANITTLGMTTSTTYVWDTIKGKARVSCLSCHRAHGTANDDLLRFAYSTQIAGEGTTSSYGCLGCHSKQR